MRKSQCERIIDYINENGSITPKEALNEFGCMRLASRINDLKNAGYKIKSTKESYKKDGQKISYARYSFDEQAVLQ